MASRSKFLHATMGDKSNLNGENTREVIVKPVPEGVWTHPLHFALIKPTGPRE